jgi:enhancing lycopene biosynthesis protein 2
MKKVGVILSGCGNMDGAEIREAVLALLALDQLGAHVTIMAPDVRQHDVIDHFTRQEMNERRGVLHESARIARGKIEEISKVDPSKLDALIIPGGLGVAKNLSDFAFKGAEAHVQKDVAHFISKAFEMKKPIGAICIAPAVLCLILGKMGITVTAGHDEAVAAIIEGLGAHHKSCLPSEICVDQAHRIVSTPAYMHAEAKLADIFTGIHLCCAKTLEWA